MADWDETTRGTRDLMRESYNRNDWPGSEYFNPPPLDWRCYTGHVGQV
jgi:hypothetical protein